MQWDINHAMEYFDNDVSRDNKNTKDNKLKTLIEQNFYFRSF